MHKLLFCNKMNAVKLNVINRVCKGYISPDRDHCYRTDADDNSLGYWNFLTEHVTVLIEVAH